MVGKHDAASQPLFSTATKIYALSVFLSSLPIDLVPATSIYARMTQFHVYLFSFWWYTVKVFPPQSNRVYRVFDGSHRLHLPHLCFSCGYHISLQSSMLGFCLYFTCSRLEHWLVESLFCILPKSLLIEQSYWNIIASSKWFLVILETYGLLLS